MWWVWWVLIVIGTIIALFGVLIAVCLFLDSRQRKRFTIWWWNRKTQNLIEAEAYHRTMVMVRHNQFNILIEKRNRFADQWGLPAHPNRNNCKTFDEWFDTLQGIAVEKMGFTRKTFKETTDIEMWKHYFHKGYEPVGALREDFPSAEL